MSSSSSAPATPSKLPLVDARDGAALRALTLAQARALQADRLVAAFEAQVEAELAQAARFADESTRQVRDALGELESAVQSGPRPGEERARLHAALARATLALLARSSSAVAPPPQLLAQLADALEASTASSAALGDGDGADGDGDDGGDSIDSSFVHVAAPRADALATSAARLAHWCQEHVKRDYFVARLEQIAQRLLQVRATAASTPRITSPPPPPAPLSSTASLPLPLPALRRDSDPRAPSAESSAVSQPAADAQDAEGLAHLAAAKLEAQARVVRLETQLRDSTVRADSMETELVASRALVRDLRTQLLLHDLANGALHLSPAAALLRSAMATHAAGVPPRSPTASPALRADSRRDSLPSLTASSGSAFVVISPHDDGDGSGRSQPSADGDATSRDADSLSSPLASPLAACSPRSALGAADPMASRRVVRIVQPSSSSRSLRSSLASAQSFVPARSRRGGLGGAIVRAGSRLRRVFSAFFHTLWNLLVGLCTRIGHFVILRVSVF